MAAKFNKTDLLRRNYLFEDLSEELLERIAALAVTVDLDDDEMLFLKGDGGDALYGVLEGAVRISVSSSGGKDVVLNIIEPGEVFGEISLLDGKPRTADAWAMGATKLLKIQRRDFRDLLAREPALAEHVIELLCDRIRKTSGQMEDNAFLPVSARLAKRLLAMDADRVKTGDDSIKISQSDLGQYLGVSRESINKHLQKWLRKHWIGLGRSRVMVRNKDALRALASGAEEDGDL